MAPLPQTFESHKVAIADYWKACRQTHQAAMVEVLRPFTSADDNTQLEALDYVFIKNYETDSGKEHRWLS